MPHKSLDPKDRQRVAIFIDGPNLFYAQKSAKFWIQPSKIIDFFSKEDDVALANYYMSSDPNNERDSNFTRALRHMGYTVFNKPARSYEDRKTKERKFRVDLDVEIVHDMLALQNGFDTAVLVSGSKVFLRTLETLRTLGKGIVVVSSREFLSEDIKNIAGRNVYFIEDIREEIERFEEDLVETD